jgi:hypothetical protein
VRLGRGRTPVVGVDAELELLRYNVERARSLPRVARSASDGNVGQCRSSRATACEWHDVVAGEVFARAAVDAERLHPACSLRQLRPSVVVTACRCTRALALLLVRARVCRASRVVGQCSASDLDARSHHNSSQSAQKSAATRKLFSARLSRARLNDSSRRWLVRSFAARLLALLTAPVIPEAEASR